MKQYVVDAFADKVFNGNPAAVCIPNRWPEDALLINIAMENNLSETAFAVKQKENYKPRWITPGGEIDLCGHAAPTAAGTRFASAFRAFAPKCGVAEDPFRGRIAVEYLI